MGVLVGGKWGYWWVGNGGTGGGTGGWEWGKEESNCEVPFSA
jgi:hypothetical protein